MNRRGFIAGLIGLAAPAVITTPGLPHARAVKLIVPDLTEASMMMVMAEVWMTGQVFWRTMIDGRMEIIRSERITAPSVKFAA